MAIDDIFNEEICSPADLLFSAFSNDRPPEVKDIEEKQREAYISGLRTGFRLALELTGRD